MGGHMEFKGFFIYSYSTLLERVLFLWAHRILSLTTLTKIIGCAMGMDT